MKTSQLVHEMLVAVSLLVVPGCGGSESPENTSAQKVVGKWIQEMLSQPSVMQTEFFQDGTFRVQKYTALPEVTVVRLRSEGVDLGAIGSLRQPKRNLTYYAINTVALATGEALVAEPLKGTWRVNGKDLILVFESEVFGKTETHFRGMMLSRDELRVHSDSDRADLVYTAQGKWEQAVEQAAPWLRPDIGLGGAQVTDDQLTTPLHEAAKAGRKVEVESLLASGANVDAKEPFWGDAPLHKASEAGQAEVVAILIARGADVNATNMGGWTPLHRAAFEGHRDVAEVLLNSGANVDMKATVREMTALQFAEEREHRDVAELIRRYRAQVD